MPSFGTVGYFPYTSTTFVKYSAPCAPTKITTVSRNKESEQKIYSIAFEYDDAD